MFGLHYLNHHLGHTMVAQSTLEAVDDMHIVNLSVWGIPLAISEWDRWHTVAEHDMLRLYRVLENEEHRDIYCTDDSPAWLCVGEDPHFEQVCTRHRETDPRIHHSPPPPSSTTAPEGSGNQTLHDGAMEDQEMADDTSGPSPGDGHTNAPQEGQTQSSSA
jgi:hypothetical protein